MLSALAKTLFGSENDRVLKRMQASVDAINALEPELEKLSDEELVARTPWLQGRIKNGETLVLTGVIQDSDVVNIVKYPFFSDLPLFGRLFRSKSSEIGKRELIVLVTPRIINDTGNNIQNYDFKLQNKESIDLINSIEK